MKSSMPVKILTVHALRFPIRFNIVNSIDSCSTTAFHKSRES